MKSHTASKVSSTQESRRLGVSAQDLIKRHGRAGIGQISQLPESVARNFGRMPKQTLLMRKERRKLLISWKNANRQSNTPAHTNPSQAAGTTILLMLMAHTSRPASSLTSISV